METASLRGKAMSLDKTQLLQFLQAIEQGQISLTRLTHDHDVYNGIVRYRCSNDWQIAIFVDCGEWDYVDEIITAAGDVVDFDRLYTLGLTDYEPSEAAIINYYGIE